MKRLPSRPDHRPWSDFDDATLVAMYPSTPNTTLAGLMGRTAPAISGRATKLGLKKSAEFMAASPARFQAGSVPKNKGLKGWQAGGRSAETRFKPGRAAHEYARYVPIGTLRIGADGRLERKYTDDQNLVPAQRWRGVHREVWEAAHGPIPPGMVVRFRDGMATVALEEITPDRLMCVTQQENMRLNSSWSKYPVEVARLIQLKGTINRQVRRILGKGAAA